MTLGRVERLLTYSVGFGVGMGVHRPHQQSCRLVPWMTAHRGVCFAIFRLPPDDQLSG